MKDSEGIGIEGGGTGFIFYLKMHGCIYLERKFVSGVILGLLCVEYDKLRGTSFGNGAI